MSQGDLDVLRQQLDALLEKNLIRKSTSPWSAPVLFVKKKDGSLRMCIDYRALSNVTIKQRYLLPRLDECLDRLGNATIFSKIDLQNGYHQVRITEKDIPKMAFGTRYGQFEFRVLPFGLCNAPATFQRLMNDILQPYIDKFVIVYLDDILIFSRTKDDHQKHLRLVLTALKEHQLWGKASKCEFFKSSIAFVGHISARGVEMDPSKVKAIQRWPQPENIQHVRQFMGLATYYRRFVKDFSKISAPLTDLIKGNENLTTVEWTNTTDDAFNSLKDAITNAPVLTLPDVGRPFVVEIDASDHATGAILSQDLGNGLQPVAFESRKLKPAERNYAAQEKEMLALVHALRAWQCYLQGPKFTVKKDNRALTFVQSQKEISRRIARWIEFLQEYDYDISHVSGKENVAADALSRRPDLNSIIEGPEPLVEDYGDWPTLMPTYLETNELPPDISPRVAKLMADSKDKFSFNNNTGILYYKTKDGDVPFIPFVRRLGMFRKVHAGMGHIGQKATFALTKSRMWWPSMAKDIYNFVSTCMECQKNKTDATGSKHEPLHPLPPVAEPFQRWALDFIGELPETKKGNRWIITAICHSTQWPIAKALPDAKESTVANFIYDEIFMKHGCPAEILTDRGANFMAKTLNHYIRKQNVKHLLTSAYHPRTNGKNGKAQLPG